MIISIGQQQQHDKFKNEELAQMLASIALYPDTLVADILMASTYPIELVEAERWLRLNRGLTNELQVMNVLQAYVDAQHEYASKDYSGGG